VDAGGESFSGVAGEDRDFGLAEDAAGVHGGGDVMDGAAGDGGASSVGLLDGVETGKCGQEAWVKVDDAAVEGGEKSNLEDAHEAGEDNEVSVPGANLFDVALLGGAFELGLKGSGIKVNGGDAKAGAEFEDAGGGLIGDDADDAGATQLAGRLGNENGFGVGAATGAKENDFVVGVHR